MCKATKANGEPCRATTNLSPEGLCFAHDPERREAAQAARVKGGEARGKAVVVRAKHEVRDTREWHRYVQLEDLPARPLKDAKAVQEWLIWLAKITVTGVIDPATSRETNRVLVTLKQVFQVQGYRKRIRELEKLLDITKENGLQSLIKRLSAEEVAGGV